jgi:hypothetical protein
VAKNPRTSSRFSLLYNYGRGPTKSLSTTLGTSFYNFVPALETVEQFVKIIVFFQSMKEGLKEDGEIKMVKLSQVNHQNTHKTEAGVSIR